MNTEDTTLSTAEKLNLETAKIAWKDLQRFFASGNAISVAKGIDLIKVAAALLEDDTKTLKQWMDTNQVHAVTDEQALSWHENDNLLWAVVIAPWVLVQVVKTED